MKHTYQRISAALLLCACAHAQDPNPNEDFNAWLDRRAASLISDSKLILENGRGLANQTESGSTEGGSTSLVDQSSTSDFASMALNLAGVGGKTSNGDKPKSGSVTVTAYSLIAAARGVRLHDPEFYKRHTNWRRASFTVGTEESQLAEHFTDKPATNLGAKFLLKNERDVYSKTGQSTIGELRGTFQDLITQKARLVDAAQRLVFQTIVKPTVTDFDTKFTAFLLQTPMDAQHWGQTWAAFVKADANGSALDELDKLIAQFSKPLEKHARTLQEAIQKMQTAPQWAILVASKQREENGVDEYRAEIVFDKGLSTRANWSLNGSFDFRDFQTRKDTRAGRLATEFQLRLLESSETGLMPGSVVLSGSGEYKAGNGMKPLVRGQAKLVIPVASGLNIPIAWSYASRADLNLLPGSQLRVSLALDPVRLAQRLR